MLFRSLDVVPHVFGQFKVDVNLDTNGPYLVYCYVVNRGGVNSRYYNNRWVEGEPATERVDTAVDFNWGEGLVTSDASDFASAQYDGYLMVPQAANYTFYVTADDGAKMWIDDELVLSQDLPGSWETRTFLLAGTRLYHVQLLFYERTGDARMRLEWSNDQGLNRTVVPMEYLYHTRQVLARYPKNLMVADHPDRKSVV